MKFFNELKRRNVPKASLAYLVIAWVLLQVFSLLLPMVNAPEWVLKTLTLILAIGFPLWVTFSWTYEVTPEGIKKTKEVSEDNSVSETTNKRLNILILITLIIAIVGTFVQKPMSNTSSKNMANSDLMFDKSIAVKPFDNESSDAENLFFVNGMMEDIRNNLSKISDLRVISKTSSEKYRNSTLTSQQIGSELSINFLLEGTVQKIGNQIKIHAQLISTEDDDHLWQDTYIRDIKDIKEIFKLQSEIAQVISAQLNAVITPSEKEQIDAIPTDNVEAYNSYLLGRFHWNKRTSEGYETSINYFEKAINSDPEFGLAYAGLADTYNLMSIQGSIDEKMNNRDKAVEMAFRALELNEHLAEAHNVLGSIYTFIDFNWEAAEREYLIAINLNPNYATVHHYYSEHLSITGRHQEARIHINRALKLDPLSFIIHIVSASLYFNQGLLDEALAEIRRGHEIINEHPWLASLDFIINFRLGDNLKALEGFKKLARQESLFIPHELDSIYQASGFDGLFKLAVDRTNNPSLKIIFYSQLGKNDEILDLIEELYDRSELRPGILYMIILKNLHSHPRFIAIQKKMGLHPSQLSF